MFDQEKFDKPREFLQSQDEELYYSGFTTPALAMQLTAVVRKWEKFYVAQCIEYDVVSQWETIEKAVSNLQEAVSLYLQDEDVTPVQHSTTSSFITSFEVHA